MERLEPQDHEEHHEGRNSNVECVQSPPWVLHEPRVLDPPWNWEAEVITHCACTQTNLRLT
jgi:hypothetical protein